jgi:putative addiction module CopG family antidote
MEIELTPEQDSFIQLGVREGRFRDEKEAVRQAMAFWEERERRRLELIAAIEEGEASFGEDDIVLETEEDFRKLAEDIKERGRAALAQR